MTSTAASGTPQMIAQGREAEIYSWNEGEVLRLLRAGFGDARRLELEAAAMQAAASVGVRVPATRGVVSHLDRPGLVMERIEGIDLLSLLARKPWLVWRTGRITGRAHADLNGAAAPGGLPDLREWLRARIEAARSESPEYADLTGFVLRTLDALPGGDRLCHGDFHPGNIMMAGDTPVVIDWPGARRGPAEADFARTKLLLRLGEPPPGTPLMLRVLAHVGRALLVFPYLGEYRRRRPVDMTLVARWEIVHAAGRLLEGIESEREPLLGMLRRAAARG